MPASTTCGSGSGFESGWQNTDYCGNILDVSLNEHSVLRIPAYIWIFVIGIASLIAMSRCVIAFLNAHVHMCSYLATWGSCFSKTIIHINLSHVGRGVRFYCVCVCVCLSVTAVVGTTSSFKAKVRYQQKTLNVYREQLETNVGIELRIQK